MNSQPNMTSNDSFSSNITNSTLPPKSLCSPPTTDQIVSAVLFSILIVPVLMGNSLVIASFKVNRRLRTKTNYFILSLAFADFTIGSICIPSYIYVNLCPAIQNAMVPEYLLVQIWNVLDVVVGVSSILNLTMISLERGYALMRPLQHRNIKKRIFVIAITTAWSLAVFAGCLRVILPKHALNAYGIIVTVPFFIAPLTIILVTYAVIFKIASAHAHGRGVRSFKKDLRIATTVAVVIGFFTVAWLPFFSINFIYSICGRFNLWSICMNIPPDIFPFIKGMQYGNSACNPIIYGFRNKDFKLAFKKILCKVFKKEVPLASYTRSTYVTTARSRFVRSDSSFDESQSVLYPDQIVPPGMYDMRESYRSAMIRGHKASKKPKPPKKDLAHGLMALNVETFSMPIDSDESKHSILKSPKTDPEVTANNNTADPKASPSQNGTQISLDIDIYPYEGTRLARDKGVVNESFLKSREDITKTKKSHVSFADTNGGLANGGLVKDNESEQELHRELSIPLEQKERSYSDVTPILSAKNDDKLPGGRRSSLT